MMKRWTSDHSFSSRLSKASQERCYIVICLLTFNLKNEILELKLFKLEGGP